MYADEIMVNELDGCPAWDYKDKKVNVRRYIQYALDRFGTAFKIGGTPDSIPLFHHTNIFLFLFLSPATQSPQ